ncbi:MAG: UDP-N-acetylmuramoyl-L-alanine--D-glutamate ligase [Saprospiraceae bacterium]
METQPNIVILGGGESGIGAALLAQQKGAKVFLSDRGQISHSQQLELELADIEFETGQHSWDRIFQADEVIKSPGIPDTVPLIQQLRDQDIPVIGEIEYASRFTDAVLIAITGSNGKTTTAYLTHHLLQSAGIQSELVGNVGVSFARSIAEGHTPQVFVIEISSFQLDSIRHFRPRLAAILNITPDHLDRYNYEMDGYIDSKFRVTMNQQAGDGLWFMVENEATQTGLSRTKVVADLHPVSLSLLSGHGFYLGDAYINLENTQLKGKHNALNALFAAGMAQAMGATVAQIQEALHTFQPVPHRLEPVGERNGVTFINDSKATNVDAVSYALDAMNKDIVWIAGGTDKGNDYAPLFAQVAAKVKALVCLGADNTKLIDVFSGKIDIIKEAKSAREAVHLAAEIAKPGQVVLLSPACASFDLFKNYIDRGDQFRAAVKQWISGEEG